MKRFLAVSTLTALLATYSFARLTRALRLSAQAYDIGLVFFWLWCILIGYLIVSSTFLPRTIGVLYALAGLGLPDPSVAAAGKISVFLQSGPSSAPGEISLLLWLLVKGVTFPSGKKKQAA
jgi:hypothetical protein